MRWSLQIGTKCERSFVQVCKSLMTLVTRRLLRFITSERCLNFRVRSESSYKTKIEGCFYELRFHQRPGTLAKPSQDSTSRVCNGLFNHSLGFLKIEVFITSASDTSVVRAAKRGPNLRRSSQRHLSVPVTVSQSAIQVVDSYDSTSLTQAIAEVFEVDSIEKSFERTHQLFVEVILGDRGNGRKVTMLLITCQLAANSDISRGL